MPSGVTNLYYASLREAGIIIFKWSMTAKSDISFAFSLGATAQTTGTFDTNNRYDAFPDNPMCGAGMCILNSGHCDTLGFLVMVGL